MEKINDKFLNWASILEWDTREQARQTASMPFIYPHLALMPDAHLGKGATVGSVIPTKGAIIPAAVGVDIGCGMMAVRTQWTHEEFLDSGDLKELHRAISAVIPLSAGNYNQKISRQSTRARIQSLEETDGSKSAEKVSPNWHNQLGSLGSGNHFIEISVDEEGIVWLFLHSGSRGVGNKLAQQHIKVAAEACAGEKLPNKDLAYLTEGTPEFDAYIRDLRWAQKFALLNRVEMMDRLKRCVEVHMHGYVEVVEQVNCHHNYTERVNLNEGVPIWLSRKGAIAAYEGTPGLIPGSMGDLSYVVEGLGNPDSLWSAPHGAGRNYSRSKAKAMFTRDDLNDRMKNVVWGESDAFLDEHPSAYKPIDVVMHDAADLVVVKHTLSQFVNVKGN